jgi:hypothetical protein
LQRFDDNYVGGNSATTTPRYRDKLADGALDECIFLDIC